jgi:murein L,D-transpeptidase YcbB/YkuD
VRNWIVSSLTAGSLALLACFGGGIAIADRDEAGPVDQGQEWTDSALSDLSMVLFDAPSHGLPSLDEIARQLINTNLALSSRERLAEQAFVLFGGWLRFGLTDQETLERRVLSDEQRLELLDRLALALATGDIAQSLRSMAPPVRDYEALRVEMMRLESFQPIWTEIDSGPTLALGDIGPRVDQLRVRLSAEGRFSDEWVLGQAFDLRLETAVRRFQGRVNLNPTGRLDRDTLAQLNITPQHRISQLRANMERRRWRSRDLGRRHIWVNLADFKLEAWEDGELAREHQVMVGRQYSSTPEFSEDMRYIVLNPWWGVPGGLAYGRFMSIRRDPGVVRDYGFRVLNGSGEPVSVYEIDWSRWGQSDWPYRLSQAPGPDNPMGEVKFIFPNANNIYLHDTNHREEFARTRRDLSAGCIRLQDPLALAEWILSSQENWSLEEIEAVTAGNAPTVIWLDERIPVHIAYWTVVASQSGEVRYLNDLYDRDDRVLAAYDAVLETAEQPEIVLPGGSQSAHSALE